MKSFTKKPERLSLLTNHPVIPKIFSIWLINAEVTTPNWHGAQPCNEQTSPLPARLEHVGAAPKLTDLQVGRKE